MTGDREIARSKFPLSRPHALPTSRNFHSAYAEQAALRLMEPLEASAGDADQLADLHAGFEIARHDVRLHHHRHVLFERHVGQFESRRPALAADDRLEIAAAETVHQIVANGEAVFLDDAGG